MPNVSTDLLWEICRTNNSFLVKRRTGGGVQFSRDPLNLLNKHSRKLRRYAQYDGFVNEKAVGIQPGERGGIKILTRKGGKTTARLNETGSSTNKPARKTYRGVANLTAKNSYRADLRAEAVARASAILRSQGKKKDVPERRLRGSKAKKATTDAKTKS
ncbi:MAG: hypothetical protein M1816_005171 [Peltula sp. TS41687]|nr:MAG: hypothetical protein M1816_005171 [Peltula sp. TS41687]